MSNPNRGRGGLFPHAPRPAFNGRGRPPLNGQGEPPMNGRPAPNAGVASPDDQLPSHDDDAPSRGGAVHHLHPHQHPRGGYRGRGFVPHDRGRGVRGYRGRGRGSRPVESL
jgi:hypothetical protein